MAPHQAVITVASAGTPVALTSDGTILCSSFLVKQHPANAAGSGYVGLSNLTKATGVGVIYDLSVITASFTSPGPYPGQNPNRLADYFLDADVGGMQFLVSWWVA